MMGEGEYERLSEFYDHLPLYAERPDIAFYVDLARSAAGPVLEVGCGTGRILVPSAEAGATMVGLDPSPAMLARCRERVAALPETVRRRVTLVQGDAREVDLGRTFRLVTLPFRVFQHLLTPDDQRAALRRCRFHLGQNGLLVFDLFNPSIPFLADTSGRWTEEAEFSLPDGRRVVRSFRVPERRYFDQQQDVEMRYVTTASDGAVAEATERFTMRYGFHDEVAHLLELEGFRVESVLGGFNGEPYGTTAYPGELIFVARKL
ncbi:MAG: class I SAM-dependent methyltransferase [Vicinamibacteraceae bacterium]|nr:class I SAM-dependent methyltransferase [Vicinamibacteraceae bacterium]